MEPIEELENGTLRRFADWPNEALRVSAPGVYTIWSDDEFLYVGISWQDRPGSKGLFGRLDSHASGRRSGDQFCVYVCDRYIIPILNQDQLRQVADGALRLDSMTKEFIRERLSYRSIHTTNGSEAREIEAVVRSVGLQSGRLPLLNPKR
jgi:hypothetical protein